MRWRSWNAEQLRFWALNTPNQRILVLGEGSVVKDIEITEKEISTEGTSLLQKKQLYDTVKKYNMHRHFRN